MPQAIVSLLAGAAIGILLVVTWRSLVRRLALPCPPVLSWLLENPIMEAMAGSRAIVEKAGILPGMQVLDAGCGPGRLTVPIARHLAAGGHVVAVDLQRAMLDRLRRRLASSRITNVTPVCAALGQGALDRNRFDRAILVAVLGEISNPVAAMAEIYESLKPGGWLSITEVLPDPHFLRRNEVLHLATRVGFEVQEASRGWGSYTLNLVRPLTPGFLRTQSDAETAA